MNECIYDISKVVAQIAMYVYIATINRVTLPTISVPNPSEIHLMRMLLSGGAYVAIVVISMREIERERDCFIHSSYIFSDVLE